LARKRGEGVGGETVRRKNTVARLESKSAIFLDGRTDRETAGGQELNRTWECRDFPHDWPTTYIPIVVIIIIFWQADGQTILAIAIPSFPPFVLGVRARRRKREREREREQRAMRRYTLTSNIEHPHTHTHTYIHT